MELLAPARLDGLRFNDEVEKFDVNEFDEG